MDDWQLYNPTKIDLDTRDLRRDWHSRY